MDEHNLLLERINRGRYINYNGLRDYNYYKRDTKSVKSLPGLGALCLITTPFR